MAVRSFSRDLLGRMAPPQKRNLALAVGWLSTLLAIAACDMGEHASARVWCSDATRRGDEARYPELGAWVAFTQSMIAFYQSQPRQSAALARRAQQAAPMGTVIYAKLASQEMRAAAMAGQADNMIDARRRAAAAIARLPGDVPLSGAFSINLADDPPYTATSTLLIGRYHEAVAATERVIQTAYSPETKQRGDHPSGYARSLLILALAHLGAGDQEAALSAGQKALNGSRPAWPTVALAGKFHQALKEDKAGSTEQAAAYHDRYLELASQLKSGSVSSVGHAR